MPIEVSTPGKIFPLSSARLPAVMYMVMVPVRDGGVNV